MASPVDINFYSKSCIRSLEFWNVFTNASYNEETQEIDISPNGTAGFTLSNDYYKGLNASRYRLLTVSLSGVASDYQDSTEIVLRGSYVDSNDVVYPFYKTVNLTDLETTGSYNMSRILEMENFTMQSCTILVRNKSSQPVHLSSCALYRSQDISSSQIGDSIGWGVTLAKVIQYLDGCELYYQGSSTPDKLWWVADNNGDFAGVNVNNERIITFSRVNEILID